MNGRYIMVSVIVVFVLLGCKDSKVDNCDILINYSEPFEMNISAEGTWFGVHTSYLWSNGTYLASEFSFVTNHSRVEWSGIINESSLQLLKNSLRSDRLECLPAVCANHNVMDTEGYNITIITHKLNFSVYQYACSGPAYRSLSSYLVLMAPRRTKMR